MSGKPRVLEQKQTDTAPLRAQIEKDVRAFLAAGNKIQKIPRGQGAYSMREKDEKKLQQQIAKLRQLHYTTNYVAESLRIAPATVLRIERENAKEHSAEEMN